MSWVLSDRPSHHVWGPLKPPNFSTRQSKPPTALFFHSRKPRRHSAGTSPIACSIIFAEDKSRRLPFTPISIFTQGKQDVTICLSERRRELICSSHMATLHSAAAADSLQMCWIKANLQIRLRGRTSFLRGFDLVCFILRGPRHKLHFLFIYLLFISIEDNDTLTLGSERERKHVTHNFTTRRTKPETILINRAVFLFFFIVIFDKLLPTTLKTTAQLLLRCQSLSDQFPKNNTIKSAASIRQSLTATSVPS